MVGVVCTVAYWNVMLLGSGAHSQQSRLIERGPARAQVDGSPSIWKAPTVLREAECKQQSNKSRKALQRFL
jgi:hypothetical protein